MDVLIKEADLLIQKESWKYSNIDADRILNLINELFDLNIKSQENWDIIKMKQDNKEAWEFIELKEQVIEGKKAHTDKTAQAYLDEKYEKENIEILTLKFKWKVVDNKLALLKEKLLLVKKYLNQ